MNDHIFLCRGCDTAYYCTCQSPKCCRECDRCFERRKREAIKKLLDWAKRANIDLRPASEMLP